MRQSCFYFTVILLMSTSVCAQRHGRCDSIQNYTKSIKPSDPQLVLDVRFSHKKFYYHDSDLRKMERTSVSVLGQRTGTTNIYEGVVLSQLISHTSSHLAFDQLEVFFWLRHRRVIPTADLDADAKTVVVDTVNGKALPGSEAFYFVGKTIQGNALLLKKVTAITLNDKPLQ